MSSLTEHAGNNDEYYDFDFSFDDDDDGGDVCGIRNPIVNPFSGSDNLTPGKMHNVELAKFPRFGVVAHRAPINSEYLTLQARLASFSGWPKTTPTPDALAAAGFFYQGMNDTTFCFQCNGGVQNWEPTDDPWVEHAYWFSHCTYINIIKGPDCVKKMKRTRLPVESFAELSLNPPDNGDGQVGDESRKNAAEEEDEENSQGEGVITTALEGASGNDEKREKEQTRKPPLKDAEVVPKKTGLEKSARQFCNVCFDETVGVLFLPCKHLVACVKCTLILSLCPVCSKDIKASVRTYFS
ncbi:baculoviral IAP repeat-containing protein 3-like isoform X2 [Cloeon dipterum]|uniref:baculoviral IAP repeat-containing protein 3-like isoform X2 n=1 Tax=Cloeon dipterum TaxID=197152 RepID=UPI00322086E1